MPASLRAPARWWCVLAAVAATAAPAPGRDKDLLRLDFDEPQIVLSPGGRSGACDALRFTRDGRQLLAVGDDKVVHTWAVRPDGLDYGRPLRWNVFRERRGAIYALALSPDERFAAVAGYGRKDADVVVLDRTTGEVVASLSAESHPTYNTARTVWTLAYDPTGGRIAVGHEDGSVWVWTPEGPGRGAVTRVAGPVADEQAVANRRARVVWAAFAGDAVRFARGNGMVFEAAGANVPPRELFRFGYPISLAVAPKNGAWLAGCPLLMTDTGTRVEFRSLPDGEVTRTIEFSKNGDNEHRLLPVALAVDPAGRRLAVGTWWAAVGNRFSPLRSGDVRLYDLTPAKPHRLAVALFDGKDGRPAMAPDALAVHPDGDTIAVAGGTDHETGLWRVEGTDLRRLGEPSVGAGRGVWQVGTRADGTVLCFRQAPNPSPAGPNDRGTGDWRCFDLSQLGWAAEQGAPDAVAVPELNGWTMEIDPAGEFTWTVLYRKERYTLPTDKNQDDRPTCYTFLPGTLPRQVFLAVGYYWGFKVFDLRRATEPRLVARGVGHHGRVTSIAPARGGKMLVTGSDDQTVGLWTLQPWDHHPVLGAAVQWELDPKTRQRAFAVTDVHAGSPAWEAGLLKGDRVIGVGYDGDWKKDPSTWKAAIDGAEPDHELVVMVERPGPDGRPVRKGVKTRMLTRPQARLFPTAGHEWVLYKYADYFYASSTNGDAYLGWLIGGREAADTPEFHPAARFREVFHRPDQVRNAVVQLVREPDRPLTRQYLPPAVDVRASAPTAMDKPVTLSVAVRPRADVNGKTIPLEAVELWLDDEVLLQSWPGTGGGEFRATYDLAPHRLRVGTNRLTVVGHARTRGEAAVEVTLAPGQRPAARLKAVVVGVDKYPYLAAAGQLTAAANDARLVRDALTGLEKAGVVRDAEVDVLLNEEATPDAILKKVAAAGKGLGPDDWLVVFLAGHGFADLEVNPPVRRVRPGTWFFCGSRPAGGAGAAAAGGGAGERQVFDFANAATQRDVDALVGGLKKLNCTVSGRDLLDRLAGLNCRKLVLLDSCHSGAIEQDPGRDLRPGGRGAVVLTASAPDETASEFDLPVDRGNGPKVERHGFFSVAVYNALGRDRAAADRNRDGLLTLEELQLAVARSVREARLKAGLDRPGGRTQTVLACPPDLRNVVFVGNR